MAEGGGPGTGGMTVQRLAAFSVHVLTASGGAFAFLALIAAIDENWSRMFAWLGVAAIVDGIDGPLARRLKVAEVLPHWSGDTLDLVVDFVTYVFVPAYAIAEGGLLTAPLDVAAGTAIVVTGALYFADRNMKTPDNYFRGFPALWNAAAFYLFLLHMPPVYSTLAVAVLIVLTFVPIHVLHPFRVVRLRWLTLWLLAAWAVLAMIALVYDFDVGLPITFALCAIAAYIIGSNAVIRLIKSLKA